MPRTISRTVLLAALLLAALCPALLLAAGFSVPPDRTVAVLPLTLRYGVLQEYSVSVTDAERATFGVSRTATSARRDDPDAAEPGVAAMDRKKVSGKAEKDRVIVQRATDATLVEKDLDIGRFNGVLESALSEAGVRLVDRVTLQKLLAERKRMGEEDFALTQEQQAFADDQTANSRSLPGKKKHRPLIELPLTDKPGEENADGKEPDAIAAESIEPVEATILPAVDVPAASGGKPRLRVADYLLTGQVESLRVDGPRQVPDGTNRRWGVGAVARISVKLTSTLDGTADFARTFTGRGRTTFNTGEPVPSREAVDLAMDDLAAQIVTALTGRPDPAQDDSEYKDSPGKRLRKK